MAQLIKHWKISAFEDANTLVGEGYQKDPTPKIEHGFLVLRDESGFEVRYLNLDNLSAFIIETVKEGE